MTNEPDDLDDDYWSPARYEQRQRWTQLTKHINPAVGGTYAEQLLTVQLPMSTKDSLEHCRKLLESQLFVRNLVQVGLEVTTLDDESGLVRIEAPVMPEELVAHSVGRKPWLFTSITEA